jgi:hypothetical protein
MRQRKRPFVFHYFWDSSSDEEGGGVTLPPPPPYNPANDPIAPRTPLGQTSTLYYDAVPPNLCETQCSGLTMEACLNLNPQCADPANLPPDGWNGINIAAPPRAPVLATKYVYIHWLITNNETLSVRPNTDGENNPYDRHYRSVVNTSTPLLYASLSLFQDKLGTWNNNDNLPPSWLNVAFNTTTQSAKLVSNWAGRGNDFHRHSISWTSTGGQLIVYHIDMRYVIDPPVLLEEVTLPTDTLLFADAFIARTNYPAGAFRLNWDGAPIEAFLSTNQNFTDTSVTIDKRALTWMDPAGSENVRVRLPSWGTNNPIASRGVNQNIVLTNRCDRPVDVTLRNGLGPNNFTTVTAPVNTQITVANVYTHTNASPAPYARQYNAISWPFDPIGTIDLDSYTTKVPVGIRRKQYSIKELVVNAWDWDDNAQSPTAYQLTPVPRDQLATCFEPNGGFRSAKFGTTNQLKNRFRFLECRLWFNNWPHFIGLTAGSTLPPINVVFDGSIRFAKTLEGLRTQYQFAPGTATTSNSYGNGYGPGDLQKNGIISLGTGTNGVGQITANKAEISWFMCRDMNRNDPVNIFRVVTLN